jgi:hypothetical protein
MDHENLTGLYLHSILCAKCPFCQILSHICPLYCYVLVMRFSSHCGYACSSFKPFHVMTSFPACACDDVGSLVPTCSASGQCSCKPGVGGPTCGDCLPDFFNLTSEGCTPCECSQFASSVSCNVTTGQCPCPGGVSGRTCDGCMAGFFNLSSGGCEPCGCDTSGSVNSDCDLVTGQCTCTRNLGGRQCNECEKGFFNTGGIGSEACRRCVCSGRSGDCSRSAVVAQLQATQFNFSQICLSDPSSCGDGWRVLAEGGAGETFFGPK